MPEIKIEIEKGKTGMILLMENDRQIGEMEVRLDDDLLIIFHTGVEAAQEGKGYAKKLLTAAVDYVREHKLKIVPLCQYVRAKFTKDEATYADVWEKDWKHRS